MAIGTLAAFWAVSFLLVLVPGADWAYAIAAGLRDRSVLPAVAGLLAGYAVLTAVVAAGVAAVIAHSPLALTVLTTFGAVYLLWLGINTVTRPPAPGAAADRASQSWVRRVTKGAGVSGLNPKACCCSWRSCRSSSPTAQPGPSQPRSRCWAWCTPPTARSSTPAWAPPQGGYCGHGLPPPGR